MMIFSLICAVMFFISAIILFMPKFRKYPFFKPFGVYMAYQGIWTLLSYLVNQLFPTNQFMTVLNYFGSFVFCGYFLFVYYMSKKINGKKQARTRNAGQKKEESREPVRRQPRYKDKNAAAEKYYSSKAAKENDEEQAEFKPVRKNRFAENSKGNSKYTSEKEAGVDLYDDYDDFEDEDELENVDDVEITDDDLDYYDEEENQDEEDEDVDLYEDLDDEMYDNEENEDDILDDDDIYFDEYDDEEEDEDYPTLRGSRYKK